MHSAMRASAFHSAAGTTDDTPNQFKHLQNSQLSQYGPSMMSKGGHTTFGGSQWNATFNQRQPPRWERRDGSTLSSAGNHIFTQVATANLQHAQKHTGRSSASVNDPYQPRHSQSLQLMNNHQMQMPGVKDQRHTNFRDVWKKAIEKYSPKKSTKLNEVSHRFQMKLEEASKIQAKREGKASAAP